MPCQGSKSIFKGFLTAKKQRESKQVVSSEKKGGRGKKDTLIANGATISAWMFVWHLPFQKNFGVRMEGSELKRGGSE